MMTRQEMLAPRKVIVELQQARLLRFVYSRRQLYEIMVDFWSNHFNIFVGQGRRPLADHRLRPRHHSSQRARQISEICCSRQRRARRCSFISTTG